MFTKAHELSANLSYPQNKLQNKAEFCLKINHHQYLVKNRLREKPHSLNVLPKATYHLKMVYFAL